MPFLIALLRILSVIAIIAGFIMQRDGWPEGEFVMKTGILVFVIIFVLSLVRIPRHSRGQNGL